MLNSWKAVTSTYHLMIKFPTDYGVRELRGSQMAARECYVAMMEMEDQIQALNIEEHLNVDLEASSNCKGGRTVKLF